MNSVGINVFTPVFAHKSSVKLNTVDHMSGLNYVIGDKKGQVILMEYIPKKQSSNVVTTLKLGSKIVTKVISLSNDKLIAAALVGGELFVCDFISKQSVLVEKKINSISFYPGDTSPSGKSRFFAVQGRRGIAYTLDLNSPNINAIFQPITERVMLALTTRILVSQELQIE